MSKLFINITSLNRK